MHYEAKQFFQEVGQHYRQLHQLALYTGQTPPAAAVLRHVELQHLSKVRSAAWKGYEQVYMYVHVGSAVHIKLFIHYCTATYSHFG